MSDSSRITTIMCQRMFCRFCTSLYQSTDEFCIKACVNKFCVRLWQAHHKALFNGEPLLTFSSHWPSIMRLCCLLFLWTIDHWNNCHSWSPLHPLCDPFPCYYLAAVAFPPDAVQPRITFVIHKQKYDILLDYIIIYYIISMSSN